MQQTEKFTQEYKRLNSQQKQAVDTIYGPVMVVAGPGTGKTQIIASRTANILYKTDTNPENIFITTFTDAGVMAIRERLIQFIGNEAYKVNVSTIHSFATEVIKTFPEKFIEYKASQAIDEVEALEILKKITDTLLEKKEIECLTSDYDAYYYLRTIKSKISNLKQEGVSIGRFKSAIKKQELDFADELSEIKPTLKKYEKTKEKNEKHIKKLEELAIFFTEYNNYLREKGLYDFDDMINFVLEKFIEDEDLVYHYAEKFQFIMLDEYQDTNNAQNQIVNLILLQNTPPSIPPLKGERSKVEKLSNDSGLNPEGQQNGGSNENLPAINDIPLNKGELKGSSENGKLKTTNYSEQTSPQPSPLGGEGVAQFISPSPTKERGLGGEVQNIMVVGDDDQSIYRFQGANIENMLEFSTRYPNTKFIVLEDNYRSTPAILGISKKLIENNAERLSNKIQGINKTLQASGKLKDKTNEVKLLRANSEIEEQTFIVNEIKKLVGKGKEKKDIAIIVRNNREVEFWTNLLMQNELEADSKLKTNILNSNYVKYILNFLEIINDPFASEKKLIDILLSDITGLNRIDIFRINRQLYIKNYSKKWKKTFLEFLDELEQKINTPPSILPLIGEGSNTTLPPERGELEGGISLQNPQELIDFKNKIIDLQAKSREVSLSEFLSIFIKDFGILEYIETNGDFYDLEDVYTLFNKIHSWIQINKNLNIESLLSKIELFKTYNYPINRQILKENNSGIQVLTAHGSKGLEFDTVFIPGLYTGNWEGKRMRDLLKLPIYISGEGIQNSNFEQLEEDRRLFFVALTRAMQNLYVSYPAGSGTKPLLESVFLQEIGGKMEEIKFDGKEKIKEIVENSIKNDLIKYDNLDIEYISEFLETYKLSPSDLNAFLEDPMIFLNRVVFKYPFEDNKYTIFGKVYHRTLELFYLKYKKEDTLPEKSYLTSTFKTLLFREAITPEEAENMLEKGINGLEGYYDLYSSKTEAPLVLEYSFRRKNIFFEGVPLTGTIDKIEKSRKPLPNPPLIGEGIESYHPELVSGSQIALFREKVDLIDYKTGKAKSVGIIKGLDKFGNKKDEKGAGNYFRQLLFYRLLCEMDSEFGAKFEVGNLAIDFVEGKDGNYKYVEVENSEEEYEDFKNELRESWEKIKDVDFWREVLGR